jgi:hypothetical protein
MSRLSRWFMPYAARDGLDLRFNLCIKLYQRVNFAG